jgi:hypothetical protein
MRVVAAKPKRKKKPLPLTSPNWWPLAQTVPYVRAQVGDRPIADLDFLQAVNEFRVPVKIVCRDRRTDPPTLVSLLLSPGEYQLEQRHSNTWMLRRRSDGRPATPPYALFFWAPRVKQIWPSGVELAPEMVAETKKIAAIGRPPAHYPTIQRIAREVAKTKPNSVKAFFTAIGNRCESEGQPRPGATLLKRLARPVYKRPKSR